MFNTLTHLVTGECWPFPRYPPSVLTCVRCHPLCPPWLALWPILQSIFSRYLISPPWHPVSNLSLFVCLGIFFISRKNIADNWLTLREGVTVLSNHLMAPTLTGLSLRVWRQNRNCWWINSRFVYNLLVIPGLVTVMWVGNNGNISLPSPLLRWIFIFTLDTGWRRLNTSNYERQRGRCVFRWH